MGRRFTAAWGTLKRELGGGWNVEEGGGWWVVVERVVGGEGGEVQLDFLEWALLV